MSVSGPGGYRPPSVNSGAQPAVDPALAAEAAPAAPPPSPLGSYTLAGTDPVRGPFRGDVTIAAGAKPREALVTYHAVFQDGSEGSVTAKGEYGDRMVWASAPLANGTGVFAPSANPGAPRSAVFDFNYTLDAAHGSAVGTRRLEGVTGKAGSPTAEGLARPSAELPRVPAGALGGPQAVIPPETWLKLSDLATQVEVGAAVPLGAFQGAAVPGAPDMKLEGPDGNSIRAFVSLEQGKPPTVTVDFAKPLTVKGPWYQPDVQIASISIQGGVVHTDARFASDLLNLTPGVTKIPGALADPAIAKAAAGFAPLARLLGAKAQAGALPDGAAIAQALQQALAANGGASPMPEIEKALDLSHAEGRAIATLRHDVDEPQGDVVAHLQAGTEIDAHVPLDLAAGRPGEVSVHFKPPVNVLTPKQKLDAFALPDVTGVRISPDGRVTIEGTSLAQKSFDQEAGMEAARTTAILAVLYREVPANSDLGRALRRAGVGPR